MLRLWLVLLLVAQAQGPERWEREIKAFEEKDKTDPPPEGEIVLVGSSSIRMWKNKEAFPDLKTINRGFGGSQIADSVYYADRIVTKYKPRIVVLFAGGNDIAAGKTPEQVFEDYQAFVRKVHDPLPKARILFISMFPNVKRRAMDEKFEKLNALVRERVKTDERLGYIDTASKMRAADGGPRPELLRDDGLHMNDEGYKIWNEVVRPYLK